MKADFRELVTLAQLHPAAFLEVPRAECIAATRSYIAQERQASRAKHDVGESGLNVLRMLTNSADKLLRGVLEFGLVRVANRGALLSRFALCALGGYGRSELSPASDLDVCLLYDGNLDDNMRELNGFLVPFLWDIGFEVNYSIRSVGESVELARHDMKAFTCVLESRLLAGDSTTFARLKLRLRELLSQSRFNEEFVLQKVHARYDQLPAVYDDLFAHEPNIKESKGGLRDYHTALWLLMVAYGPLTVDDLVTLGVTSPEEHLALVQALDFIWRVRNELHFHAGREDDILSFDNQKHVAEAFGYGSEEEVSVNRLMQDYYLAARKLRRLLRIATQISNHPALGPQVEPALVPARTQIVVEEGQLAAGNEDSCWFTEQPSRLMEVFWECARHMAPLNRATERGVTRNLYLVNDSFRSSDLVRRFFIAICNRPLQAGFALRQASNAGLLSRYLPEFEAVQGLICYEDFHHFPVDEHTLRALSALAQIPAMKGPVGACLHKALEHLPDPYILTMAVLFHDLGKVKGEVHVEEGVILTKQICARIGMPEEDAERIAFIVQNHLLMTHLSQYRDIDDNEIVEQFARTMKTEERLRILFLFSYADLAAVGPDVWNDWKGALLSKLYLKAEKILLGRAEQVGEEYWKSPKANEVRALVDEELRDEVEPHLQGLGERYFLAFSPRHIAQHIRLVVQARECALAVHCSTHEETGMSEVVVCTGDRHGLFAKIAGSFTSQLVDINNAALFTRPDGIVVDCFTVSDPMRGRPLTEAQAEGVVRVLHDVLLNDREVQQLVDQSRRRLFALLQPRIAVCTQITFDNESSRTHTVIDIETGDRTGLLYDITQAIAGAGLDIATARIVTDARRIRDSFYVTLNGKKIESMETQAAIRDSLQAAIHPRNVAETKGDVE